MENNYSSQHAFCEDSRSAPHNRPYTSRHRLSSRLLRQIYRLCLCSHQLSRQGRTTAARQTRARALFVSYHSPYRTQKHQFPTRRQAQRPQFSRRVATLSARHVCERAVSTGPNVRFAAGSCTPATRHASRVCSASRRSRASMPCRSSNRWSSMKSNSGRRSSSPSS